MSSSLSSADLLTLVEVSRSLAQDVNLRHLMANVLTTANHLTASGASSILLYDDEKKGLYFAHVTGPTPELVLERWGKQSSERVPLDGSKAGEVFTSGQPIMIEALQADPEHFKAVDRDTRMHTESMVCVPMTVSGERIGVIQILNKRTGNYDERDLLVLEHFSSLAAVAIRNASLFDQLLAHMGLYTAGDPDTGPVELMREISRPARNETLSVLFADMRGFTQLCHLVTRPERAQELLNEFLSTLSQAVIAHDGIVNKFLGDGLLALFRGERRAANAVRSAFTMVAEFHALRARWNEQTNVPLEFLDLGVGITSDSVILGPMGSEYVRDFTAVGTAVNLAANLMEDARDGRRILVDKMTFLGSRELVAEYEGPEGFELKKRGQTVGHPYERFHLKSLRTTEAPRESPPVVHPKPQRGAPTSVFISYSHHDRSWLDRLRTHLKPYARNEVLGVWDDTMIRTGDSWRDEIERALESAKVAVLLVSPEFLDSEFIAADELPPLLAASERGGTRIFWIPLSFSSYDETPIGRYQAALDPARPLDTMSAAEQNRALVDVCKALKEALQG
ncbi:MAG TPA: GAF domain-containing protein [Longimicrobiaceae bacterium]|nr:GAF domain-containing protein [Longimicrobiaceae bacterium]